MPMLLMLFYSVKLRSEAFDVLLAGHPSVSWDTATTDAYPVRCTGIVMFWLLSSLTWAI